MNIEATAYALLVYVPRHDDDMTNGIVRWLNTQRLLDAGWASTQVRVIERTNCKRWS